MALNRAVTDFNWSPNFDPGRPFGEPATIYIHHWGKDGQKHQDVVNYLCATDRDELTSAHYVASAGRVTQLVHDYDRAWHAGNIGNPRGIGIECRPEMSAADFEQVARLIAAIRDEWGDLPLRGHRDAMVTACPGRWYPRLAELSARADQLRGGNYAAPPAPAAPAPTPGCSDITALQRAVRADPDNVAGPDTCKRIMAVYHASGWGGREFPFGIAYAQQVVGADPDGIWGRDSNAAHDRTVEAIQRAVGADVDGIWGPETDRKVANALNNAEQP